MKIIAGDRHIVRIAGHAALLIQSAGWIEAAVVHVIAGKVVAASELCQRERLGIERRNDRAAVVRTLIARPDLAGQKRHGMCRRGIRPSTWTELVAADIRVVAPRRKQVVFIRAKRPAVLRPRCSRVGAVYRERLSPGKLYVRTPAGHGIQWRVHSAREGQRLEPPQIFRVSDHLVFEL